MQDSACHTSNMRLACVQAPVIFADPTANATYAEQKLIVLAKEGVDLAVFPEAFLTGYCVDSQEAAAQIAISPTDASIRHLQAVCDNHKIHAIVGFGCVSSGYAELPEGISNALVLFTPNEAPRYYAKTHLPYLGFDRFATPGHILEPFDTSFGRVGTLICYDLRPPEATRVLALKSADLVVLPTNWPEGAETSADHGVITRAIENRIFFASCNRVGTENGFTFIGRSKIVDHTGKVLASAGHEETVLIAELNLSAARQKRAVLIPGKYELEIFGCRQPGIYGTITEPQSNL